MNLKILVFPKDKNPYQELLYSGLRKKRGKIKYIHPICFSKTLSLLLLIPLLVYYRILNYKIFHLHWTGGFASSFKILRPFYSIYFIFILIYLKILRYKIVWTVHNVMPHEKQFTNDLEIRKILSKLADAKIVHSNSIIDDMNVLGINTENTTVTPLGSYMGIYENKVSKKEARKKLKISQNDFVFLFLGNIRRYKGIEDLLEAFHQLSKKQKKIGLILAGECNDPVLLKEINDFGKKLGPKLISHIYHIKDKDIQYYFNSADITIFPFKKVTTSSSVILAISFAKLVIIPRIGCLKELPEDIGFFYDSKEKKALYKIMEKAIKNKRRLRAMGDNAFNYAKSLSWDKIAEKTYEIYQI